MRAFSRLHLTRLVLKENAIHSAGKMAIVEIQSQLEANGANHANARRPSLTLQAGSKLTTAGRRLWGCCSCCMGL